MNRTCTGLGLLVIGLIVASSRARADTQVLDWANLKAYRLQNAAMRLFDPMPHRVVFFGDSITEFWDTEKKELFSNQAYVNRGISGQTTPQMLIRFRQDVIDLHPEVVVILAGTNDIAGNTGPATTGMIADNISSMTELARTHGIKVVLGTVLPAARYPWAPDVEPIDRIEELNRWITTHARRHGFTLVDFHASMVDGGHGLKAEYSDDGVHPNSSGYRVMTQLVRSALTTVVGQ